MTSSTNSRETIPDWRSSGTVGKKSYMDVVDTVDAMLHIIDRDDGIGASLQPRNHTNSFGD